MEIPTHIPTTEVAAMIDVARMAAAAVRAVPSTTPPTSVAEVFRRCAELDALVDASVRAALTSIRPDARWLGEFDDELPRRGTFWLVDGVDGAVQCIRGLPDWAVSVTLVEDGAPTACVLHHGTRRTTTAARRGDGAAVDGTPASPSPTTDLAAALVCTSHPPRTTSRDALRAGASISAVIPQVAAVRNLGATAHQIADVAAGRVDAFWMIGRDVGNLLGPAMLAEETGAPVTTVDGDPWSPASDSILVSAPGVHGRLVELLSAVRG